MTTARAETPGVVAEVAADQATRFGIRGASHSYSVGVPVLKNVDLELRAGAIHGLVGENGSGKSTLVKLLTGVLRPQIGTLYLDEREVSVSSPTESQALGIGVVHQDYNLFSELTVAQNVFGVGRSLPRRRLTRTVDTARIESRVGEMLSSLGIDLAPNTLIRSLDAAEKKFVEIVRAMWLRPRCLILDEPTASLEPQGSKSVLALLQRLREQGVGLCFISHRLNEVLEIADRITVLRDGECVGVVDAGDVTHELLVNMIVGRQEEKRREAEARTHAPTADAGEPVLRIVDLRLRPGGRPVNFEVKEGEILGLTGLLGSGAATVAKMLGGEEVMHGFVEVGGKRVRIRSCLDAKRLGIGFIPEDRKAAGAVAELSVAINISLASLDEVARAGLLDYWRMRRRGQEFAERLDVRATSIDIEAGALSGGNLQKVVIAKWLATDSRILAVEEPTHGVDVGAKAQVHELLRRFVSDGGSIVVALSESDEALEFCDRIAVFRQGELINIVNAGELTRAELTLMGASDRLEDMIEGPERAAGVESKSAQPQA